MKHLLLLLMLVVALQTAAAAAPTTWDPQNTSVFVVSMTRFKDGGSPWGTRGRLDHDLMKLFASRGVPADRTAMLGDEGAEIAAVQRRFVAFLEASRPGETLFFDFSSHGGYDPKSGTYTFYAYDGPIRFDWFFDAIEKHFRGARVLMVADCCYSGGIVELARRRPSRFAFACLSSTYAHNVASSGWRFFDCLLRGFGGNPVVDLDGDGTITLEELARFSERHMAFVAEGHPMFLTSGGFDPKMALARARGPRKPDPVGRYVEALRGGDWRKAEIVDTRPGGLQVHFTDSGINTTAWLRPSEVRPFTYPRFAPGATVEVERDGWDRAVVREASDGMVLCRFDGYPAAYDEWVGPSRLRAAAPAHATNLSGRWEGRYVNSTGQEGADSLVLSEDEHGNLQGKWSDDVPLSGRRLDDRTARLSGRTRTRDYSIEASLRKGVLTLRYRARRLDSGGTYEGTATFTRKT